MRLENFDLNLLVALDALLRRHSVTEAAEELHVTQSAMSSALRRMREHFGDDIVFYDGQKMVPTTFGRAIERQIPQMLSELRNLSRLRASHDLSALRREFSLIASDYVCAVYLSVLSKHLSRVAPHVSLNVLPFTQEMLGQFHRGVIDFLISPTYGLDDSVTTLPLYSDTFSVVMCANNPKAKGEFTPEDYLSSSHIITQFIREGGRSHLETWFDHKEVELNVSAALSSFVVLPHFITGTQNVATVHNRLLAQIGTPPGVVLRQPPVPIPPLEEMLVTTRKHLHDSEAQMVAEVMLEVGAKMENPQVAPQ